MITAKSRQVVARKNLKEMLSWQMPGVTIPAWYEFAGDNLLMGRKISSEEFYKQCQKTYQRMLPKMQEDERYAGKVVGISGDVIVGYADISTTLLNKSIEGVLPRLEVFYVPRKNEKKVNMDLRFPSFRLDYPTD